MKLFIQIWILQLFLAFGIDQRGEILTEARAPVEAPAPAMAVDPDMLERISTDYPFIDTEADTLAFADNLQPFFDKLRQLERGEVRKLHIVHIGDSHLQADMLTGEVRKLLQARFGSAGRGLVFPYRVARTNGPLDYRTISDASWEARKSIYGSPGPPIGISGMGLRTAASAFLLDFKMTRLQEPFDKVTVFYNKKDNATCWTPGCLKAESTPQTITTTQPRKYHKVKSGETLSHIAQRYHCTVKQLQRWNGLRTTRINIGQKLVIGGAVSTQQVFPKEAFLPLPFHVDSLQSGPFSSVFLLDTALTQLTLKGTRQPNNDATLFYGWYLENTRDTGIIYSTIGVNGATYAHYNRAEYFKEQLPALAPDLVVISLGTNESLGGRFSTPDIQMEVNKLLESIRAAAPGVPILICSNPDALRRRRYLNPNNLAVRGLLRQTAADQGLGWWDMHTVMGGHGSIRKWRSANLAQKDFVHFTGKGYQIQGDLLFAALMQAYDGRP